MTAHESNRLELEAAIRWVETELGTMASRRQGTEWEKSRRVELRALRGQLAALDGTAKMAPLDPEAPNPGAAVNPPPML